MALTKDLTFALLGKDVSASKTMSATGKTAETTAKRIGSAFSGVGGVLNNELGGIFSGVGAGIDSIGDHVGKWSSAFSTGGVAVAGAGLALSQFGSGEQAAQSQLAAAISTTGHSFSDYKDAIDKTIAKQENFGNSAVETQQALTTLTTATGSPKKALADMGVVANLAAARHISLSSAASQVARVLGGSGGRTLAQYGITMQTVVDPTKAIASAQDAVTSSTKTLSDAQTHLTQLQAEDHEKKKLTLADQFALQNAEAKVTDASDGLTAAQKKLADAQQSGVSKTQAGSNALDQLSSKLKGQATASVNSFGGQLNVMRVKITDAAEAFGQKFGPAMQVGGSAAAIAGSVIESVGAIQQRFRDRTIAAKAATEASTVAQNAKSASSEANVGATEAQIAATDEAAAAEEENTGSILSNIGASIASKAQTVALVAMYTGEFAASIAKSTAAFVVQKAQMLGSAIASGALKVAQLAGAAASGIATAAQWAFNAALDANPIGLIIVAIAALVAGLVWFFTQTKLGKAVWQDTVNAIGAAVNWLWNSVVNPVFQFIGGIFNWLANNVIRPQAEFIQSAVHTIGSVFQTVFGAIGGWIRSAFSGAVGFIRSAMNGIIDVINDAIGGINVLINGVNLIPGVHVPLLHDIPHFASGVTGFGGGFAMVGENGPEVTYLPPGSNVYPNGTNPLGASGGQTVINVTINAGAGLIYGTANQVAQGVSTALINAARSGQLNTSEFTRALGI